MPRRDAVDAALRGPDPCSGQPMLSRVREPLDVVLLDLGDPDTCDRYFQFRTEHFAERLQWNVRNDSGIDRNELDDLSVHLALQRPSGDIVGCIRLSPPAPVRWMIDDAPFDDILDPALDPAYPRQQAAEVSRFGIDPAYVRARDRFGHSAGRVLRRAAYQQSLLLGLRYWYVVAYETLIRSLVRHDNLPFRIISRPARFDDQFDTCIACLDLAAAYIRMADQAPAFLQWNNDGLPLTRLAVLMGEPHASLEAGRGQ
jgi:N-acyl-L-homoserine lactone synthetase